MMADSNWKKQSAGRNVRRCLVCRSQNTDSDTRCPHRRQQYQERFSRNEPPPYSFRSPDVGTQTNVNHSCRSNSRTRFADPIEYDITTPDCDRMALTQRRDDPSRSLPPPCLNKTLDTSFEVGFTLGYLSSRGNSNCIPINNMPDFRDSSARNTPVIRFSEPIAPCTPSRHLQSTDSGMMSMDDSYLMYETCPEYPSSSLGTSSRNEYDYPYQCCQSTLGSQQYSSSALYDCTGHSEQSTYESQRNSLQTPTTTFPIENFNPRQYSPHFLRDHLNTSISDIAMRDDTLESSTCSDTCCDARRREERFQSDIADEIEECSCNSFPRGILHHRRYAFQDAQPSSFSTSQKDPIRCQLHNINRVSSHENYIYNTAFDRPRSGKIKSCSKQVQCSPNDFGHDSPMTWYHGQATEVSRDDSTPGRFRDMRRELLSMKPVSLQHCTGVPVTSALIEPSIAVPESNTTEGLVSNRALPQPVTTVGARGRSVVPPSTTVADQPIGVSNISNALGQCTVVPQSSTVIAPGEWTVVPLSSTAVDQESFIANHQPITSVGSRGCTIVPQSSIAEGIPDSGSAQGQCTVVPQSSTVIGLGECTTVPQSSIAIGLGVISSDSSAGQVPKTNTAVKTNPTSAHGHCSVAPQSSTAFNLTGCTVMPQSSTVIGPGTAAPNYNNVMGQCSVVPQSSAIIGLGECTVVPQTSTFGSGIISSDSTTEHDSQLLGRNNAVKPNPNTTHGHCSVAGQSSTAFNLRGCTVLPQSSTVIGPATATPDYNNVMGQCSVVPQSSTVIGLGECTVVPQTSTFGSGIISSDSTTGHGPQVLRPNIAVETDTSTNTGQCTLVPQSSTAFNLKDCTVVPQSSTAVGLTTVTPNSNNFAGQCTVVPQSSTVEGLGECTAVPQSSTILSNFGTRHPKSGISDNMEAAKPVGNERSCLKQRSQTNTAVQTDSHIRFTHDTKIFSYPDHNRCHSPRRDFAYNYSRGMPNACHHHQKEEKKDFVASNQSETVSDGTHSGKEHAAQCDRAEADQDGEQHDRNLQDNDSTCKHKK